MKKVLLIASFASLSFMASAQFSKGQKVLSGSVSFGRSSNPQPNASTDYNNSSFSFSPAYGWFTSPNNLVGIKLIGSFYTNKQNNPSTPYQTEDKGQSIGAGFFVQKLKPIGKDFFLFAEMGANATYRTQKWTVQNFGTSTTETKGYAASVYITPGLGYKITNRLIADITLNNIAYLNFNHGKSDYKATASSTAIVTKSDAFGIGSGLEKNALSNVGIGIRWILK